METELGVCIRKYRLKNHMTLVEMGDILKVSYNTVYLWEKGKIKPRTQNLIILSRIMDIPVKDIIIMSKTELT